MNHRPKYSETAQRLINACQAIDAIPFADVVIDSALVSKIEIFLDEGGDTLFEFCDLGNGTAIITLKP